MIVMPEESHRLQQHTMIGEPIELVAFPFRALRLLDQPFQVLVVRKHDGVPCGGDDILC